MLVVLSDSRVLPLTSVYGFYMFIAANFIGTGGLANVDRFFIARALVFVYTFPLPWRRFGGVFATKNVLKLGGRGEGRVDPSLTQCTFKLVGDARDVWDTRKHDIFLFIFKIAVNKGEDVEKGTSGFFQLVLSRVSFCGLLFVSILATRFLRRGLILIGDFF